MNGLIMRGTKWLLDHCRVGSLPSKHEGQGMFLLFLLRDCRRTRSSGPSRCPRFCRSQRYVKKTKPSFHGGVTFREAGPGLPKSAGW